MPIDQVGLLMLGPGISISHAAVNRRADNNCLVAWVGEKGIRLYAHGRGGTFSARRLLSQARRATHDEERVAVVYRMYGKRFPDGDLAGKFIEQVRGMEGIRVRRAYAEAAKKFNMEWHGRNYNQDDWFASSDVNRALSAGNACLYGVCHAAGVSSDHVKGLLWFAGNRRSKNEKMWHLLARWRVGRPILFGGWPGRFAANPSGISFCCR